MYNLLKNLCMTSGISGRENSVREKIISLSSPLCDGYSTDNLGNLIAVKHGTSENPKKIMLCAHMDEIGFLVTFIEKTGYLRIAPVGGINFHAAAFSAVISGSGVPGVIVPESGVKPEDYSADKFYIDIGAKDKKEAEKKVKIGDFFVVKPELIKLCGKKVAGRPLDDRAGCAILIEIMKSLSEKQTCNDVYYVFSVQEEVGCRGAKPASFGIAPDYALVFDVTATGDSLGAKPMECRVGDGAAIKIKDSSVICNTEVVEKLRELAEKKQIKHQTEILTYGGTDTSSIQMSGAGVKVGALSVPARYIHSGTELIDLSDATACAVLAEEFILNIYKE